MDSRSHRPVLPGRSAAGVGGHAEIGATFIFLCREITSSLDSYIYLVVFYPFGDLRMP